jgi:hypothetical protein
VRCPKCGYSNDPEFRFCGMCGAPLARQQEEPVRQKSPPVPPPPPAPENKTPRSSPLPGFSVLADDDEDDLWPSDDPPGPRKTSAQPARSDDSLFTRRDSAFKPPVEDTRFATRESVAKAKSEDISYPLRESYKKPREEYSAVSGPSFLGLDPIPSSEPAPQYLLEDDEPSGHGRLFVGILLLLAVGGGLFWQWQREGYPWNPSPKQSASSISAPGDTATSAPSTPGSSSDATPTPSSSTPAASTPQPDATTAQENKATPPSDLAKEDKPEEKAAEAAPAPSRETEGKPEAKAPKPTATPAKLLRRDDRASAPAPNPADLPDPSEALFIEGQKYLYGSGVLEDCNRARTKLMAAANQSNVKAQSTVATMYATGHCMPRNLPMAYHWFAIALHKDRDNTRLQRDLEMLWNQMTPEEKQMAIKTR